MSKGIVETIVGGLELAAGIVLEFVPGGQVLGALLIGSGAGLLAGGIGTLLTKQQQGLSANVRNSIQPWNVVYGRARIGGTIVYIEETGTSDKYLHMVYVLACHPCQSLDAVLFDGKRTCLDTSGNSLSFGNSTGVIASQQTVNISSITRVNDVVTVVLANAIPLPASTAAGPAIDDGDTLQIQNVSTDQTLNGQYQVQVLDPFTITYICGGNPISIANQGQIVTTWPDYGDTIHVEAALGTQGPGNPPFPGLLASGDTGSQGLWTANHLLQGRSAVYLRLKYGGNTYASGMPTIAFRISGKNDIYDPRTGGNGYTTNAVLCTADFLSNTTWGFKAAYHTEIPAAPLIAGANISDEAVALASGAFGGVGVTTWEFISGVATQMPTGTSTYSYQVVAKGPTGTALAVSLVGTTSTAAATLSGTVFNAVNWGTFTGASSYDVYRTAGPGSTGKIRNVSTVFLNDTGYTGDGTSVPTNVAAGGPTESRYTCNGSFQLSAKRGEILQNLLTSCGGRLTYSGGQYVINPAAWTGTTVQGGVAITNGNGSPVTSATLYVLTSHIPGAPTDYGCIAQDPALNPIALLQPRYWVNQSQPGGASGAWTLRADSAVLSVSELAGLSIAFGMSPPGARSETTPDQLQVYDCWVTLTYADGTGGTYRPTVATVSTYLGGSPSDVTNPNNAIDGNQTDCATISTSGLGTLDFSALLIVSNFHFPGAVPTATALTFPNFAAGPFQWKPKVQIRDLFNGVKATYVSPLNNWQGSDAPPYAQDTDHGYPAPAGVTSYYDQNLAADGGERRWYDMQLPFTISASMAQRLMKIELMRKRQQGMGTFVYNLAMYQLMPLDVITMTVPYLGWTNKLLEVSAHRFTVTTQDESDSSKGIRLGTEIDVQETDPSVYTWSTSEELTPEGYQQASTNNVTSIAAPTGVTLANATVTGTGLSTGQVQVSWTAPTDGYIVNGGQTIVQYSLDDTNWTGLGTYDPSVTTTYIPDVAAGQQYWVRTAFINTAGIQSGWTVQGPITATGSSLRRKDNETPSGTINGTNTTFTLSQTPNPAASLDLYLNGDLLLSGVDFTLSGNTITLSSTPIPNVGDWLRATYWF